MNNRNLLLNSFFLCFLLCLSIPTWAQDGEDWVEDSDIEDATLVITKKKVLTVPKASRLFSRMEKVESSNSTREQKYKLNLLNYQLSDVEPSVQVLKMKKQPLDKLYGNYVKGGFGTYLSPYFEGHINSKRSSKYSYGVRAKHLSSLQGPVDTKNSANSLTQVGAYGKYFLDNMTVSGGANYERKGVYFYGYTPPTTGEVNRDSIKQAFNIISANIALNGGAPKSPFTYKTGLDFYTFSDNYKAKETNVDVLLRGNFELSDESYVSFGINPIINSLSDSLKFNRNIIKAGAGFHWADDGLSFKIGGSIAYNFDSTTNIGRFGFYPDIEANYEVLEEQLSIFASVKGDLKQQTLRSFTNDNPFINDQVTVRHTHQIADIQLGFQATPVDKIGIRVAGGYSLNKNMHFFVNDTVDAARFNIWYDSTTVGLGYAQGELSVNFGNFSTILQSAFYAYNTKVVSEAFHRPTLVNNLGFKYNHRDKIYASVDIYHMGGIKARAVDGTGSAITLDNIIDANLKVDYLFSDVLSAFVSVQNMLGKKYQRYYRYPVKGFQVMAGATYAF